MYSDQILSLYKKSAENEKDFNKINEKTFRQI